MKSSYKRNWSETYERFEAWWKFENTDRPLMRVVARNGRASRLEALPFLGKTDSERKEYSFLTPEIRDRYARISCEEHEFLAEAFPCASLCFGPGAMATFLGSKPNFAPETVWYELITDDPETLSTLKARFDTKWWRIAEEGYKTLTALADEDYLPVLPDVIDSMDTLASLLGSQNLLYALIDEPESIKTALNLLDDIYFEYFDRLSDITRNSDGIMSVEAFSILGRYVAKLQCDFSAMISPAMFDEFVAPTLAKYCARLGHALYHIDGQGEMCHVDTMLKIKGLDAFQWIPQVTSKTPFTDPEFYPMFDKIHAAGKGLYLAIDRGTPEDWADETERLIKRYGTRGMYFLYPDFPDVKTAEKFIARFEK